MKNPLKISFFFFLLFIANSFCFGNSKENAGRYEAGRLVVPVASTVIPVVWQTSKISKISKIKIILEGIEGILEHHQITNTELSNEWKPWNTLIINSPHNSILYDKVDEFVNYMME